MLDNPLITLLISTIRAGLTAQGITVGIRQNQQPTIQGTPSQPTIYLSKIGEKRYGSPELSYGVVSTVYSATEVEVYETTYQVNCLVLVDPSNQTALTQADYLKAVTRVLQSQATIQSLQSQNVGIYRIQATRQTYFKDDKGQFEASPSFDFTVTHSDVYTYPVDGATQAIGTFDLAN